MLTTSHSSQLRSLIALTLPLHTYPACKGHVRLFRIESFRHLQSLHREKRSMFVDILVVKPIRAWPTFFLLDLQDCHDGIV